MQPRPEVWSLNIRGRSGIGKSVLCAHLVKYLTKILNMNLIVVSRIEGKDDEVKRLYGNVQIWRGLTFTRLKNLKNHIVVFEDYTIYRKNKTLQHVLEQLITTIARVNRILTILIGHRAKMEMPTGLEVEVAVTEDGRHIYQIREGRKTSAWFDCEWNAGEIKQEKLQPLLDAFFNPLKGKEAGFQGRRINPYSKRQKCFKLFDEGKKPSEVCRKFGYIYYSSDYEVVMKYYEQWKRMRKLISIPFLSENGHINVEGMGRRKVEVGCMK